MGALAVFTLNLLPEVEQLFGGIAQKIVDEVSVQVLDLAVVNCPERSGFLASSGYIKSSTQSTYGAEAIDPPGDSYLLPELETPPKNTDWVSFAANYAIFVELGTRFMAAEPYLVPALEEIAAEVQSGGIVKDVVAAGLAAIGV